MANNLPDPASRKEEFLAKAAGKSGITLPEPASREEEYLNAIAKGGGGGGTTYTAGDGIDITDDTISVDTDTIQEKLTAGTGIDITGSTISATGGGGGGDTVYSDKSTSNSSTGGAVYIGNLDANQDEQGDPTTTDNHYKYFCALPLVNSISPLDGSVNILGENKNPYGITIGAGAETTSYSEYYGISIGNSAACDKSGGIALGLNSHSTANNSVAIGRGSNISSTSNENSVALGSFASTSRKGEVNVGTGGVNFGYNNTDYRVIGGVHDPIDAHDAATKGYVDANAGGVKTLTSADYNFPNNNPFVLAPWLLPPGQYIVAPQTDVMPDGNSSTYNTNAPYGILVFTQAPSTGAGYGTFIISGINLNGYYKVEYNGTPVTGFPHEI